MPIIFILIIALVSAASATTPDLTDRVLVMYKLSPYEAAQFSTHDGRLAQFWSKWETNNVLNNCFDYININSDNSNYAWNACATSPYAGPYDAQLLIRAAYTEKAALLYVRVIDNYWMNYAGWWTDVIDLYFDPLDSAGIADPMNWFNPTQWALSFSSKQINYSAGNEIPIAGFNYRFYNDTPMTITDHWVLMDDSAYDSISIEIIFESSNMRLQEWKIPWSQWGVNNFAIGKRYCFAGGYNDVDNDAPDCTNSLRFVGLCDTYCEPPNPATWGEVELGPALDSVTCDSRIAFSKMAVSGKKSPHHQEFYSLRGEKLSGLHPSAKTGIRLIINSKSCLETVRFVR